MQDLSPEVEELRHLPAFVIASQHINGLGEVELEGVEEEDDLAGERPAVDVVAQEQILRFRGVAAHLQQLHEVVELPVDVAHHCHRIVQAQKVRLFF